MKRQQLIEFLSNPENIKAMERIYPEQIADALIKEGIVKVDEPREFWLSKYKAEDHFRVDTLPPYNDESLYYDIIKVREVIE